MQLKSVNEMLAKMNVWRGALALSALLSGTLALGQTNSDWPTFKGTNQKVGANGSPNLSGPGRSLLHWYAPNNAVDLTPVIVDNTDINNTKGNFPGQGPFDLPNYNSVLIAPTYFPLNPTPNRATEWSWPTIDNEASFPYLLPIRRKAQTIGATTYPVDFNTRFPAYIFTNATPSKSTPETGTKFYDPTKSNDTNDRRFIRYVFRGPVGVQRNYALYVWLPVGPTVEGGATLFPQRYFVYEVRFGPNGAGRYIDVVDTYASGGGWVRIGNGGGPTDMVFPWDGTNQINLYLYNTVPRDASGVLTMPHPINNENYVKKYLVYGDAAKAVPVSGYYSATPIAAHTDDADPNSLHLFDAKNELTVGTVSGTTRTIATGTLTSRIYNGTTKAWEANWKFRPTDLSASTTTLDNSVASVAGSFVSDTTSTRYSGTDVYIAPCQSTTTATATYTPSLNQGTYEIYAFLPGDNNGLQFGQAVQYRINAEGTTYTFAVDQSQPRGWVKIGDRRFAHTTNNALSVVVTNQSALASDVSLGKQAYADAIRFVGERNQEISSTPVFATVNIRRNDNTVVATKVMVVADEGGVLHCLDAKGNADGTTTEYWTYPSTKTPDPNQVANEDGVGGLAEMPTGFELSSALVQRVSGVDYLYIGGRNGRVYCIEMLGRGDYTARASGTTRRRWTYPSTYPSPNPITTSPLGSFRGSIVYGLSGGVPTVYVPTTQGRLYALDARGSNDKSTTVRWAFPKLNEQTLGPIWMTPAFDAGALFFGTLQKDDTPGRFFSVNANTGLVNWELATGNRRADDFLASPAVVSYRNVTGSTTTPGSIVYTLNQNRVFYAIDSLTGAILWQTDEIGAGARGAITYTRMTVYDNLGALVPMPVVVTPTLDGRFVGLFANPDYTFLNRFGTVIDAGSKTVDGKICWGYTAEGDSLVASTSVASSTATTSSSGQGWMFGADNLGFLYAFHNDSGNINPGDDAPGQEELPPNDTRGDIFRKAKLRLVTRQAYQKLRLPTGDAQQLTYQQALSNTYSFTRTPLAFEWGETAYIMVYDFPFMVTNPANQAVPPPIVNVSFNVDGRTIRGVAVEARRFQNLGSPNPPTLDEVQPDVGQPAPPEGDLPLDGYAILAFPFQGGGANALPPGDAEITFSVSTQSLNSNGAQQNVMLNPNYARKSFQMANPIAISMDPTQPNAGIGLDVNPGGNERLFNGSLAVGSIRKDLLGATTGWAQHGQSKSTTVYVYDTSMMGLLRPDGMGLDGIRLERTDLRREGGAVAVYKPLNPALYPGFEDLPTNFPNTSVDYPDIPREQLRAIKDPTGNTENPLFNGVQLVAPLIKDATAPGGVRVMQEGDKPEDRVFRATPFQLEVEVPRYQPPVALPASSATDTLSTPDSLGRKHGDGYLQGYMARLNVFVDSFQNGNLDATQREAYRGFNLATAVAPDEQVAVTTPSIDLGSLASGSGFSTLARPGYGFDPTAPFSDRIFDPWNNRSTAPYPRLFKEFTVQNRGNVNMLNLRLAKAYDSRFVKPNDPMQPWPFKIASPAVDPFAWLESGWQTVNTNLFTGNIWSDMDWQFSPWPQAANPDRNVILQKPRVTDRIPTELSVNPRRRTNPNIGAVDSPLFTNLNKFPVRPPRVAATIPLGFPVGRYTQRLRVIEDSNAPSKDIFPTWDLLTASTAETASDPTFDLFFTVRETRLTSSYTPGTDRQIDDLSLNVTSNFANQQPTAVRDAFGSLIVAFSSNRPSWNYSGTEPTGASPWGLFIASLDSDWTFSNAGMTSPAGQNPLAPVRDLNNWNPGANNRWWKRSYSNWPRQAPNTLFGSASGESIIAESVRYFSPSFPQTGMHYAFDPNTVFQGMYMVFVGEAQKLTPTGRVTESRLMGTIVTTQSDGSVTLTNPFVMAADPYVAKGKPTVLQTSTGAMVFYSGNAGGQSRIYYSRINGTTFGPANVLPFGNGFDSVSHPSAAGRPYYGLYSGTYNGVVELTFNGKLKGRTNNEVFIGRMPVQNGNNLVEAPAGSGILDESNAFLWMQTQVGEKLTPESTDTYRARGVMFNTTARALGGGQYEPAFILRQFNNGVMTDLLLDGWSYSGGVWTYTAANDTRAYDRQTGLLSFDTRLGGKAYIDPNVGTVRFSGGTPPRGAEILMTYQPRFIRVTTGQASGYADATGLWDGRLVSDPYDYQIGVNQFGSRFWRDKDGNVARPTDPVAEQTKYRNDRLVFTYTRGASGTGQAARPYISTFRIGVRLPTKIQTDANGVPVKLIVSGNNFPYQIDAAQGRIYLTAADEDRPIRVTYWGVDDRGNAILNENGGRDLNIYGMNPATNPNAYANATWVGERGEEVILIEQAVNEAGISPFLDPFNYLNDRRPPLIWLFWSSTRSGQPDLYFETIAPQWSPILLGK